MGCCLSKKPSPSLPSNGISCAVQPPDPIKPIKPVIEPIEEPKPKPEKLNQEDDTKKEVLVIKHRRSHEERSKKINSDKASISPVSSPVAEKSNVRISSCTKEEVDAILIQCGKLSRNNSAAKTRRYSGSKRSFDFDQNEKNRGGDAEEEEEEAHRHRHRVNSSPRERRRRTPSREREDSKNHRSGSRERGNGGGSRRVSRSPAKRTEVSNPNSNGSSVNSSNNRPKKFVTVPATEKTNNVEPSNKRITVKRNIGEACRTVASPRSKSPARAGSNTTHPPPPSLSRSNSRKATEQSPYRRNPLGEIDQNSTKLGSCNIKKMIRAPSPNRATAIVEVTKPPQVVLSRSRSLRKSRDFDLVSNEDKNYTALLLKDIQNFHGKSGDDEAEMKLPLCVTKACSIVEAVADLNLSSESGQFRFTSTVKKADLMEPSFEKYVTVKRGGSLEAQESSGSNNLM